MNFRVLLRLGRVSNLPTVVSNTLAGTLLGTNGLALGDSAIPLIEASLCASALYVGGMFLNDAFDAEWDARHRPERPIAMGEISRTLVFVLSALLLIAGAGYASLVAWRRHSPGGAIAALVTSIAIIAYNRWHKGFGFAPVIMGLCRAGAIGMGALLLTPEPQTIVWVAAACVWAHTVGLTHVASFEAGTGARDGALLERGIAALVFVPAAGLLAVLVMTRPAVVAALLLVVQLAWQIYLLRLVTRRVPRGIPRAVGGLIAGMALLDAGFVALDGPLLAVAICFSCWPLTLLAQRRIAGT